MMEKAKKPIGKPKNKRRLALLSALGLAIVGLLIWTLWANKALEVNTVTVSGEGLPSAFNGYRIAHLSDLHNAEFGDGNEELLELLSDSRPNIIVITGDLVDSRHSDLETALHFAKEAAKIAPTYYVSGNHEAWIENYDELCEGLADAGVTVLRDEAVPLERDGETVWLLGIDDPDFAEKNSHSVDESAQVEEKLQKLTDGREGYTILLSHRPEYFDSYAACGIDLTLSGHAHGGQFRLPLVGGLYAPGQGFFPEYDAGLYTKDGASMVVSRGLGNSVIPLRFNNRPEIVLVELVAKENG